MCGLRNAAFAVGIAALVLAAPAPTYAGNPSGNRQAPSKAGPTSEKAGAKDKASAGTSGSVVDRFDIVVHVDHLRFYEASSGFFSSGKGKALKELRLWHGAHEITVDVKRLQRVVVHRDEIDKKNDLIWVTVTLTDGTQAKAKVETTLEVRGTVHLGTYKIQIDRVKRIEFDR